MKKSFFLTLATTILVFQTGCTVLRYSFEPALNQIPKDATVTKITNDYIEYSKYSTNVTQATIITTTTYRAYYTSDGKIFDTKQTVK
jgi:hypothetical protein